MAGIQPERDPIPRPVVTGMAGALSNAHVHLSLNWIAFGLDTSHDFQQRITLIRTI